MSFNKMFNGYIEGLNKQIKHNKQVSKKSSTKIIEGRKRQNKMHNESLKMKHNNDKYFSMFN
ncbi:hypothetical protein [Apilactobacillus quenuiae]|uniref:hypothetical protein n=1 Tax=Apilactobacillus quenuiae TaxID=2008377 RepID=UPI000D02047D|nr:hypothetical protein [Apilactobacillus quenuiae]